MLYCVTLWNTMWSFWYISCGRLIDVNTSKFLWNICQHHSDYFVSQWLCVMTGLYCLLDVGHFACWSVASGRWNAENILRPKASTTHHILAFKVWNFKYFKFWVKNCNHEGSVSSSQPSLIRHQNFGFRLYRWKHWASSFLEYHWGLHTIWSRGWRGFLSGIKAAIEWG
jgi:hypothetical protein